MASQVFLQHAAVFASSVPQNHPLQCSSPLPTTKQGFSPVLSRNVPLIASVSFFSGMHCCTPLNAKPSAFVERAAESNPEEGAVKDDSTSAAAESNPEEVPEAEAVEQAEEEPKPPRKPRVKLGDIMGILNQRAIGASDKERPTPDLRTGDIVEIKLEVPENKRRLSIYKGIVILKQNAGIHTTIRVRRIIAGVGVEIVFPVYSPYIKEIKVVNHRKVRRARLYYLRDKLPRLSTFK